jgi:hypothetical protein
MQNESVLALDLEGTLISNAVSQFPRPGLHDFLEFCRATFESIYLYTAVRDELCVEIMETLVNERIVPSWMLDISMVQWDRKIKDLANIPNTVVKHCLIVDDNVDYIALDQRSQWIAIEKFESPYSDDDRELARVQQVIAARFAPV